MMIEGVCANLRRLPVIPLALCLFSTAAVVAEDEGDDGVEVKGATLGRMGDPAAVDPGAYEFAAAEQKLWMDNHLQNIDRPGRLYYDFVKRGTFEEGFSDSVYLDVLTLNEDGSKNADMEFFTGERRQVVRPDNLVNITGNPVLTIYMQGDVYDMNRLTEGSWRYFQRRIKSALAEDATVEPVTFEFDGEQVSGEKISITPYINDPRRRQLAAFASKVYEFTLSDQVPGTLYRIKTVIPGEAAAGEPLLEEVLTLQSAEFED